MNSLRNIHSLSFSSRSFYHLGRTVLCTWRGMRMLDRILSESKGSFPLIPPISTINSSVKASYLAKAKNMNKHLLTFPRLERLGLIAWNQISTRQSHSSDFRANWSQKKWLRKNNNIYRVPWRPSARLKTFLKTIHHYIWYGDYWNLVLVRSNPLFMTSRCRSTMPLLPKLSHSTWKDWHWRPWAKSAKHPMNFIMQQNTIRNTNILKSTWTMQNALSYLVKPIRLSVTYRHIWTTGRVHQTFIFGPDTFSSAFRPITMPQKHIQTLITFRKIQKFCYKEQNAT